MIDYKKLLNYIMMYKSWEDTLDESYDNYCYSMESGDYLNEEEWGWLSEPDQINLIVEGQFRELIDNIFKIMGIYKEPVYIVE